MHPFLYPTKGTFLHWGMWAKENDHLRFSDWPTFNIVWLIFSTPVTGSINTSFATWVSSTHIAQSRWTHLPFTVCLKAPPLFGHSMYDWDQTTQQNKDQAHVKGNDHIPQGLQGTLHFLHSHCPSRMYGTPLVYCEIASITENDGITIFSFGVVTDGTCRVFRWKCHIGFGDVFSLKNRSPFLSTRTLS